MNNKVLKTLTLISSFVILIGFGHGIGPIIIVELPYPLAFRNIDLASEYNYLIYPSVIFFIGHICYIIFLFTNEKQLLWVGLGILWIGLFLLIKSMFTGDAIGAFALISGIPFMILSVTSFIRYLRLSRPPKKWRR